MVKIISEKTRYLESLDFNTQMKKNPGLLIELLSV